jgi:hypothetical protein
MGGRGLTKTKITTKEENNIAAFKYLYPSFAVCTSRAEAPILKKDKEISHVCHVISPYNTKGRENHLSK